jgi:hypothetical protein
MTSTTQHITESAGRCPNQGDGDAGTRARSATCGKEACSINNAKAKANSPPDGESTPICSPPNQTLRLEGFPAGTATISERDPGPSRTGDRQQPTHVRNVNESLEDQNNGYDGQGEPLGTLQMELCSPTMQIEESMAESARSLSSQQPEMAGTEEPQAHDVDEPDYIEIDESFPVDMDELNRRLGLEGADEIIHEMEARLAEQQAETEQVNQTTEPTLPKSKKTAKRSARRKEARDLLMGVFDTQDKAEQATSREDRKKSQKKKRSERQTRNSTMSGVCIGTLNLKGFGETDLSKENAKWNHVNQLMRDKKIGVLVVQEAHMSDERRDELEKKFHRRLKIFSSADPDKPTEMAGVAVVFNKDILNVENVSAEEIIPGRAMLATFKLRRDTPVRALVVYAYNNMGQNANLWLDIATLYRNSPNIPPPNMILGDFNMTEDAIDRMPARNDPEAVVRSLQNLKSLLNIKDAWRESFPDSVQYSYMQNKKIHSRLDRIYMTDQLAETAVGWKMEPSGIKNTDHDLVSVVLTDPMAPDIGKGRWTLPIYLLKDRIFISDAIELGNKAQTSMTHMKLSGRSESKNAQTIFAKFKMDLGERAKDRDNEIVPKIVLEQKKTEKELKQLNEQYEKDAEHALKVGELRDRLRKIAEKRHLKKRKAISTKYRLEGEQMTKTFARMGKEQKARDIMWGLKSRDNSAGQPVIERDSEKMAEIARAHHDSIQRDGITDKAECEARSKDKTGTGPDRHTDGTRPGRKTQGPRDRGRGRESASGRRER